jgi:AcrR family transcriptional regulator
MTAPPSRARRSDPKALVKAATALFVRYGVRRTSMEDVAREADVAKGTLYLAFASKDALFRAVCEDLCATLLQRAEEAVVGVPRAVDRIEARLVAKYVWLHGWVNASPHAAELLASKDSIAADVLKAMDTRYARQLAGDVEEAQAQGALGAKRDALEVARLLMRVARSCALPDEGRALPSEQVVKQRLEAALAVLLRGLKP